MAALNAQPPPPGHDLSSLEHTLIGAAPLGDPVLSTFLENVRSRAHPNMTVRQIYGLTETCEFSCLFAKKKLFDLTIRNNGLFWKVLLSALVLREDKINSLQLVACLLACTRELWTIMAMT